ncbi:hypothetical protein, partial [Klebsiella variicola]|uniref:hypothetical protein n=1 Tax=Klebsiella variicola TaxID=244366 RepID=UPI0025A2F1C8
MPTILEYSLNGIKKTLNRGNLRFVTPLFLEGIWTEIMRRWPGLAGIALVISYRYLTTKFVVEQSG